MEVRLLWEILRDRYKALSLVTAGFVFFAVLLLILAPTIYESTAHIMVKKADEYTSFVKELPQSFGTLSYIDTDNLLGSIDLFLRNEVLVSQVMRKCNLHDVVSFPPNKFSDPGLISILFRKRGVGIESEKDTEVFSIKGLSPDIKEAQKIANTFLEQFLQYYAEQKRKEIEKAKSSYVQKAAEMRTALLKIEQEELEYRTRRNVIDFDLQKQKLIDRLKELNASRDELKTDLASLTESYNELKEVIARNSEYHKVSESISKNDLIQYYKQEIAQQEGQLEAKKLELTAEHPEIRTIEKKIAALRNLMNKEKEKIFSSTLMSRNTYYDTLIQKREDHSIEVIKLQGGIEANENQAQAVTEQLKTLLMNATGLLELVRKRMDLETTYKSVDQAVNSLNAALAVDLSHFFIINKASIVGRPKDHVYAPDASLFLALFGVLGLISGVVLIFLLEYADNAPRLFHSFEQLCPENRSFAIKGRKGWTLLAADLARQSPASIAVLHRGGRSNLHIFTQNLLKALAATQLKAFAVYVQGEYRPISDTGESLSVTEEELSTRTKEILDDLSSRGYTALSLFPPLNTSTGGYLAGDLFDCIIYVVHQGKISFEDIRSDINFFYDRKWQSKVVGVFYAE